MPYLLYLDTTGAIEMSGTVRDALRRANPFADVVGQTVRLSHLHSRRASLLFELSQTECAEWWELYVLV